ncbi:MAG: NAD(P)/FAD-dependent oxidoreductase [Ruminococcaceae bacterium]|nr:NAD(P)/FAD-dependent oxidoreductase [Oscillospiraceae bacterium]
MNDKTVIIIGSGPAGVSASLYTKRAGIRTIVISKSSGALEKAHWVNNYYGFPNPISGQDLLKNGVEQASLLGVEFVKAEVFDVSYNGNYTVSTDGGVFNADGVIIAMGTSRKAPLIKGITEFEGRGVSYCAVCDAFFFRGKNVAVLGNSEYAKHEAAELIPLASSVTVLTDGSQPETDFSVPVITDKIVEICGNDKVDSIAFESGKTLVTDGLFVACGTAGSSDIARKLGIAVENGKIITDNNMSCGFPGIYAAGDCTGGLLQISKAVYEGALAGTEMIKYIRSIRKD